MEKIPGNYFRLGLQKHEAHIYMLDYVAEALIHFWHNAPPKPQYQLHSHIKPKYGSKVKYSEEEDSSLLLGKYEKYYPRSHSHFPILLTGIRLHNTSSTRIHRNATGKSNQQTMKKIKQYLYYATTNTNAISTYRSRNMILAVKIDASHLSETNTIRRAGGD